MENMEGSDQEDKDLDEIAAQIITIGARNLESLKENKKTDSQNIFDSPQKQTDNENKVFVQPNFFGPGKKQQQDNIVSEEHVALIPTPKSSAADITQSIIEEIHKPVYKTVVEAEFVSEENVLSRKSSKTDAEGDTQDRQEVVDGDQVNVSVAAETSKGADKESARQKPTFTPPPPVAEKPHWKKRLQKFLTLGVARKLKVGYPPGHPIPKLPKSALRKKRSQANKNVEPQAKLPAHRSPRESHDAQVNNKKGFDSKFAINAKGDIIMLNNIKKPNTSGQSITNTNEMRSK